MIEIRQENQKDYEEVYRVIKTAFETAEHSDGNEHDLVVVLRNSDSFIPELSYKSYIISKKLILKFSSPLFYD